MVSENFFFDLWPWSVLCKSSLDPQRSGPGGFGAIEIYLRSRLQVEQAGRYIISPVSTTFNLFIFKKYIWKQNHRKRVRKQRSSELFAKAPWYLTEKVFFYVPGELIGGVCAGEGKRWLEIMTKKEWKQRNSSLLRWAEAEPTLGGASLRCATQLGSLQLRRTSEGGAGGGDLQREHRKPESPNP